MTDEDIANRAFTLAEMASDDSVTMSLLAGRQGRFSRTSPLEEPPVTYLQETEAPAYVLTNAKRGVGRGVKHNTVTPDEDYRTVVLITGRRTVCLVGQQGGDVEITVPHDAVAEVQVSRGFRKHRLELRTPESAYHCWVHRKTDTALLDRVSEFIADRQVEEPAAVDDEETTTRVMYRGRPVVRDTEGDDETASAQQGTDEQQDGPESIDVDNNEDSSDRIMWRGRPVEQDAETDNESVASEQATD
jgi:hypothetical protein